ncbi:MAG TPA: HAD family hydrolase [Bacilli bacterium]|nr:HAD family hydrolase [Bacilli bacterium]
MKIRKPCSLKSVNLSSIDAIFCDIDGTIADGNGVIPLEVIDRLKEIKNHVRFYLISGRYPGAIRPISEKLELTTPLISLNGALVVEQNGNVLHEAVLPNALALKVAAELTYNHPDVGLIIYTSTDWLTLTPNNIYVINEQEIVQGKAKPISNIFELSSQSIIKLLFLAKPETIQQLESYVGENYPEFGSIISKPYFLELLSPFVNKGRALYEVAEENNICLERAMCIGDGVADLPMFDIAYFKVAPENADSSVKKVANIIVPSVNEGGIKELIDHLLSTK